MILLKKMPMLKFIIPTLPASMFAQECFGQGRTVAIGFVDFWCEVVECGDPFLCPSSIWPRRTIPSYDDMFFIVLMDFRYR